MFIRPDYQMRAMVEHSRRSQVNLGSQVVLVDPRHRGSLSHLEVQLGRSLAVRPWSDIRRHQGVPVCLALPEGPFGPRHLVHPERQLSFRNTQTLSCMGGKWMSVSPLSQLVHVFCAISDIDS